MKRLLSLALSTALLAALALPASAAEENADARLANVTQAVKSTLSLDTGGYDTFHGGRSDELSTVWELSWEGGQRSLSIQALEDGTVISLNRWEYDPSPASRWGNSFPAFPENGGADARALAEDFLNRVLRQGETVELAESKRLLSSSSSSWSGTIALNGLPSPLYWSIRVENGMVEHFSREMPETTVIGGVPSPDAQAGRAKAAEDLGGTLKLRLEYVLEKPGGTRAVLRYTPERTHEFQADAITGALIDVTELEEKLSSGFKNTASGAIAAADSAEAAEEERGGLTEAEQEGIRKMEGVLSEEALDKALRAESAYGLRGYALVSSAYTTDFAGRSGVFCTLRYARTDNGQRLTRNITVDAKTGSVENIWSSAPLGRDKQVSEEEALKKAEAFLKTWSPDRDLVLYQSDSEIMPWRMETQADWHFTFAQKVNGLPFRGNAVHVGVDSVDGSIYRLSCQWDEDVTFDTATGLISMETALSAWAGSYEAVLAYRSVPRKLTRADPVQARLMNQGMEYYYALHLTYALEREGNFEGVDAKTGALVQEGRSTQREPLAYTDISGNSAKADIEKLAEYGVGYASERFYPSKNITQWELVALLESLQGAAIDPGAAAADARDSAYYNACRLGLLRAAERDDEAILSRETLVKMLLNAAGYGPAARLSREIFTCDYSDKQSIFAAELGYAAIAQALGMASGTYAGSRLATRGEAASMLCRLLERDATS